MKTFRILTLGCKVNQYESEAMAQQFLRAGYAPAEANQVVSVSVVNTCSVTNMSDRKSRKMIRQCAKDSTVVAVCGCYAQAKPEEAANIEGVDLVIGNGNKHKLFSLIEECLQKKEMEIISKNEKIHLSELTCETSFDSVPITEYREKTRAILKIQDGCNSFCSYCIIPYVRGRLRSRNPLEILEEARLLAKNGYREIVLAGIHVCKYGIDFQEDSNIRDLTDLLQKIEEIDGICRIRLSSIEPFAFHEKFFQYYAKSKKLCPSFHISLQSGSDTVLKRMNRHYTAEYYLKTVEKLREIKPETTITTDVIVGFPGETEEEFEQTVALVKQVKFLKIHTFPYSRRSGTVADSMPDQISTSVKEQRSKIMLNISEESEREVLKEYIGKKLSVLAEEPKTAKISGMYGFSANHLPVIIQGTNILENQIYEVIPRDTDGEYLYATLA